MPIFCVGGLVLGDLLGRKKKKEKEERSVSIPLKAQADKKAPPKREVTYKRLFFGNIEK